MLTMQKEVITMTDATPSVIRWEEPPSQRSPRTNWQPTADQLIQSKDWGLVQQDAKSAGLTSHIKTGRLKAFRPAGAFDARSVKKPSGAYDIYAVFVGDEDAPEFVKDTDATE